MDSFVNDFINGWFKLDPSFAVYEGKHEFDGQLPDWSDAGLKRAGRFPQCLKIPEGAGLSGRAAVRRNSGSSATI